MENQPQPLEMPGWTAIDPSSRMYTCIAPTGTSKTRVPLTSLLSLYRWDAPSTPQLIERLCVEAERCRGPPRGHQYVLPGNEYRGSIAAALREVSPALRSRLASRDPELLERASGMIEVYDERLRTQPLSLVHMQYAVIPTRVVTGLLDDGVADLVPILENTAHARRYVSRGLGDRWLAKVELTSHSRLEADAAIVVVSYDQRQRRDSHPHHREEARSLVHTLARVLNSPDQVAKLYNNSELTWPMRLLPVLGCLEAGMQESIREVKYEVSP